MKFKAMFQPIEIGNMTVKNRFVVPPMGNNFANTDGTMSEQSQPIMQNAQRRLWPDHDRGNRCPSGCEGRTEKAMSLR